MQLIAKGILVILILLTGTSFAEDSEQVSQIVIKRLLTPWQSKIQSSRRNAIHITLSPAQDTSIMSKVGGKPYLPKGQSLPTDSNGKKMYLLAQINFEEMPHIEGFPKRGLLQIFIGADEHFGMNLDGPLSEVDLTTQKNFRIVYHDTIVAEEEKFEYYQTMPDKDLLPFSPNKSLAMKFKSVVEVVGTRDFEFTRHIGIEFYDLVKKLASESGIDEELLQEGLENYFDLDLPVAKIGGYASFTQEDPREVSSQKRLLFQLSSTLDDSIGIMWGDMGIAGFFIDKDRLQRSDFSEVMYSWDCS